MDLELAGKRAFVTGASAGIGAGIARRLAREGCAVLVHGRDAERAGEIVAGLRDCGVEADAVLGELGDDDSCARVAERARHWEVDIICNNAGPFAEHDWLSADPKAWLSAMNLNVISAVRVIQALLPDMRRRGWGRIINIGTRAVVTPLPNMVEYSAAKAAVANMTTSLAQYLAGSGITANLVSPGVILSPGMRRMFEDRAVAQGRDPSDWEDLAAAYAPNPSGRLGTVDDIAAAVAFLSSPLAGYINGTNMKVDGGITGVT